MKTLFLALRSVIYMTGFLLLFAWIALRVRAFDPRVGVSFLRWPKYPGLSWWFSEQFWCLRARAFSFREDEEHPPFLMLREPSSPSALTGTSATQCTSGD
jgi:hypothetical protein